MSELTYYSRLKTLSLESLELRRIRADLILVYKLVFGLVCVWRATLSLFPQLNHSCVDIHIH